MARDFFINGPTLVGVKGNPLTEIASLTALGLSDLPIRVSLNSRHMDIAVDAYGGEVPPEVQHKLIDVIISMTLVHVDRDVLDRCLIETMGGATAGVNTIGQIPVAGARLGNNSVRFSNSWHYISLNITSPSAGKPWRFKNCYLLGQPCEFPLGTERSIFNIAFRCIPYTTDPYNAGFLEGAPGIGAGEGSAGYPLWDHTLDGVLV